MIVAVVFLVVSFVLAVVRQSFTAEIFALWAIATALLAPAVAALL